MTGGGTLSGQNNFRLWLPVMGGQNSHGEALSIQKTVLWTVSGRMDFSRLTVVAEENEKGGKPLRRSPSLGFVIFEAACRLPLFPILEDVIQCCIQSRL